MASIINATTTAGVSVQGDNSGSLQLATNNGTTAVTIDTSQNVGIGTSSPETKLHVTQTNDALPALQLRHGDGDFILMEEGGGTDLFKFSRVAGSNDLQINNVTANNIRFATNNTERMRITSGGALCVGTTSATGSVRFIVESDTTTLNPMSVSNSRATASTDYSIIFYRAGNIVGSVQTSLSATSFVTSSDYRLKENIAPMTGALAKVAQLNPVTYDWKAGGSSQGFIAHELQAVVPDCVTGEKDAVDADGNIKPQGVDTSFLVATLTAAIQELKAELDATKAEVQALKGVA